MTDGQMYQSEMHRPHLQIEIPSLPDFGNFEDMPRDHPILNQQLADNFGEDEHIIDYSNASTPTLPEAEEDEPLDYIMINICGYPYKIITTGLTDDEIEKEIELVQNEALDFLLDSDDERYMA